MTQQINSRMMSRGHLILSLQVNGRESRQPLDLVVGNVMMRHDNVQGVQNISLLLKKHRELSVYTLNS